MRILSALVLMARILVIELIEFIRITTQHYPAFKYLLVYIRNAAPWSFAKWSTMGIASFAFEIPWTVIIGIGIGISIIAIPHINRYLRAWFKPIGTFLYTTLVENNETRPSLQL